MAFVSPEMVTALAFLAVLTFFPQLFDILGSKLTGDKDQIKFLALIPVGILGLIIHARNDLLFPSHPFAHVLQEWPDYFMILDRYWFSVLICALCILISVGIWILNIPFNNSRALALFLCAITEPVVTYICFHAATIRVRRELARCKKIQRLEDTTSGVNKVEPEP